MTENEVYFLPLRVTGVTAAGKRKFDAEGKRKLIVACRQPGASIAGLALKAGVNANQLHKWIQLRRGECCCRDGECGAADFGDRDRPFRRS